MCSMDFETVFPQNQSMCLSSSNNNNIDYQPPFDQGNNPINLCSIMNSTLNPANSDPSKGLGKSVDCSQQKEKRTGKQPKINSDNGSSEGKPAQSSYKYLSWREKDRRRRFREEWKNLWLVIPHGKYEVMCLVCHKVMTQRKLDTIKRHTIRRHVELLSMTDADREILFNQLMAVHTQQQIEQGIDPEAMIEAQTSPQTPIPGRGRGRGSSATWQKNLNPVASVQLKQMNTQQFSTSRNQNSLKKYQNTTEPSLKDKKTHSPKMKSHGNIDWQMGSFQNIFEHLLPGITSSLQNPLQQMQSPQTNAGPDPISLLHKLKMNTFQPTNPFQQMGFNDKNLNIFSQQSLPEDNYLQTMKNNQINFMNNQNPLIRPVINNNNTNKNNSIGTNYTSINENPVSSILNSMNMNGGGQNFNLPMILSTLSKMQTLKEHPEIKLPLKGPTTNIKLEEKEEQNEKDFTEKHPFSAISLAANKDQDDDRDFKTDIKNNPTLIEKTIAQNQDEVLSRIISNTKIINTDNNKSDSLILPNKVFISSTSNNSSLQIHVLNYNAGHDLIPCITGYLKKHHFPKAVIINCQGSISSISLSQLDDELEHNEPTRIDADQKVISLSGTISEENTKPHLCVVLCNEKGDLEGGRLNGQMITKDDFKIVLLITTQCPASTKCNDDLTSSVLREKNLSDDSSSCYSATTPDSSESPNNTKQRNLLFTASTNENQQRNQ